ncbi:MAG: TolC family protein, partial [Planctomycetota bacterium]
MHPSRRSRSCGLAIASALSLFILSGCTLPRVPQRPAIPQPTDQPTTDRASPSASGKLANDEPPSKKLEATSILQLRLHAVSNHHRIRGLYETWSAARARAPQARALPEPHLTYTEFLESVETRTGPQERSFGIRQAFPWFGKLRLKGSIEEKRAAAAWQRFLAAQIALDSEVRSAYADYYVLGQSISLSKETLELLGDLEEVARQKYASGAKNHPDVIRLQVEIVSIENQLASLNDRRAPLRARLNYLLSRPGHADLPWPSTSDVNVE